jgi:hypothetical protein
VGGGLQLPGLHDAADEPERERLGGVEAPPGEDDLQRALLRDEPGEADRAAGGGDQAARHLREPELRAGGGHDDVARERELQPTGQGVAVHRGDDRLGARHADEPRERRRVVAQPGALPGRDGPQVRARAERAALAGEDRDAGLRVGVEALDGGDELAVDRGVDRVEPLGAPQRDPRDVPVAFVGDDPLHRSRTLDGCEFAHRDGARTPLVGLQARSYLRHMLRTRSALLAIAAAAATTFATAATAQAACSGSTPANQVFADDAHDADLGIAPEITTVTATVDAECNYRVDPGIASSLWEDDAAFIYVDTDGSAATGDPVLGGADIAVGTFGTPSGQLLPLRGDWDGEGFAFTDPEPFGYRVANGGFRATVDELGIAPGAATQIIVATLSLRGDDLYADFAPEPDAGRIALPVNYMLAPPPVASPAPVPGGLLPTRPRTPRVRPSAPQRTFVTIAPKAPKAPCAVPKTKGLTVGAARTRLRAAGCSVATATTAAYSPTVRRGRVVGTTVPAGRASASAFRIIVSKGKRPRRAKASASATVLQRLNVLANATR